MKQHLDSVAQTAASGSATSVTCAAEIAWGPLHGGRFLLGNGLRVLLVVDPRAPVFAFQTWFRVGSKHENPERTGMAHLFEHLMFKGTQTVTAGELDREIERRGSETNAATWVDWTFYLETLAARDDNLDTVLAFESDRMAHLVLDDETFASELEVVKNERRTSIEDSVPGELSERLYATAFTQHPYRWPTIGEMAHLESATPGDLERFYRTFYAPNNATVVIVGDLDISDTLTRVARAYGDLASQPMPEPTWNAEPAQSGPRQLTLERSVLAPMMVLGFRTPAQLDPDTPAVEMLGEILVSGSNARLYHRLVTREALASEVSGFLAPFAEPGLYEIAVTARPDVDPQRIVDVVQEELDHLQAGVSATERSKAVSNLELHWLDGFKDAEGCAEALGHFESNFGDGRLAFAGPERWTGVSDADLRRVAAAVFTPRGRTVVSAVTR
jgi:zinc protease